MFYDFWKIWHFLKADDNQIVPWPRRSKSELPCGGGVGIRAQMKRARAPELAKITQCTSLRPSRLEIGTNCGAETDRSSFRGGSSYWEGDLIIGKGNQSQVGTLVERITLFVALVKLDSATADEAAEAFTKILNGFESQMRRSMTYDQGVEMRHHKRLTANTGVDVYFAHPHAPWERGIMENTNGLLRQYLPKETDLSVFSQEQLDDIAWLLNARPRKTLGWRAPAELFLPEGAFDFVQYWPAVS